MSDYVYTALRAPKSIRLIHFKRRGIAEDGPLHICLIETDLTDRPAFEATSYTWGDLKDKVPINVDGNVLYITVHLDAFLRHLSRQGCRDDDVRLFWADQICINQKDTQERNQQVALMADIYRQSQRTLVWIDKADEHTNVVAGLLAEIETLGVTSEKKLSNEINQVVLAVERFMMSLESVSPTTNVVLPFEITLNRPWFTRSWIIQEVALAQQTLFHLGSKFFRWESLDLMILAFSWLHRRKTGSVKDSWVLKTRAAHTSRHVQFCRQTWSSVHQQRQRCDFLQTLKRLAMATECSDPRDLVYAFLSLQETLVLPPADYALEVEQVYSSTSARLAASSESLDILGWVRRTEYLGNMPANKRLPSWAIDWRYNTSTQGSPFSDNNSGFAACGTFKYKPSSVDVMGSVMIVKGKMVDKIGAISYDQSFDPSRPLSEALESLLPERLLENIFGLYSKVGARTVDNQAKIYSRAAKARVAYDPACDDQIFNWDSNLETTVREVYSGLRSTSQRQSEEQLAKIGLFERMRTRSRQKVLFLSHKFLRFGLAPRVAIPGDLICILHGSSVPVVLRGGRASGRYTVIGQCYLEDWMHGKRVNWVEDEANIFELE